MKDDVVETWVRGLPEGNLLLVSLLGVKPGGKSEYNFYSFRGAADSVGKPTFQEWLGQHFPHRAIDVVERPTHDFAKVPPETVRLVQEDVERGLSAGSVVIFDSGGEQRTRQVCKDLGLVEDSGNH